MKSGLLLEVKSSGTMRTDSLKTFGKIFITVIVIVVCSQAVLGSGQMLKR